MPFPLLALAVPGATGVSGWLWGSAAAVATSTMVYGYHQTKVTAKAANAYRQGRNESMAEYELKLADFQAQVQTMREADASYYRLIVSMVCFAYSYAHNQNKLTPTSREKIDFILIGQLRTALPEPVLQKLQANYQQPAALAQARSAALRHASPSMLNELIHALEGGAL